MVINGLLQLHLTSRSSLYIFDMKILAINIPRTPLVIMQSCPSLLLSNCNFVDLVQFKLLINGLLPECSIKQIFFCPAATMKAEMICTRPDQFVGWCLIIQFDSSVTFFNFFSKFSELLASKFSNNFMFHYDEATKFQAAVASHLDALQRGVILYSQFVPASNFPKLVSFWQSAPLTSISNTLYWFLMVHFNVIGKITDPKTNLSTTLL